MQPNDSDPNATPQQPASTSPQTPNPPASPSPTATVPNSPSENSLPNPREPAEQPTGAVVMGGDITPINEQITSNTDVSDAKKPKSRKPLLVILSVVLLLIVGSGVVYAGVIVPNKPENVLQSAVKNSLQQTEVKTAGQFETEPVGNTGGIATKVTFASASDTTKKVVSVKLNATISGATLPLELRYVDQDLYVKAGDLAPLAALAGTLSPELASVAQAASKQLSNQWIVIDSTLIKQAGASCVIDAKWSLPEADLTMLMEKYSQNKFVTISSHSSDTINGKKVEKFALVVDDDAATKYVKNLSGLSIVKDLKKCDTKKTDTDSVTKQLADHDKTSVTIWVNKRDKEVVRVGVQSSEKDAKKSKIKGSMTANFTYGGVSVQKPDKAKPATQVMAELQTALDSSGLGALFSDSQAGAVNPTQ